jgi:hypothetical protein
VEHSPRAPIRTLIVDDHPIVRRGITVAALKWHGSVIRVCLNARVRTLVVVMALQGRFIPESPAHSLAETAIRRAHLA